MSCPASSVLFLVRSVNAQAGASGLPRCRRGRAPSRTVSQWVSDGFTVRRSFPTSKTCKLRDVFVHFIFSNLQLSEIVTLFRRRSEIRDKGEAAQCIGATGSSVGMEEFKRLSSTKAASLGQFFGFPFARRRRLWGCTSS